MGLTDLKSTKDMLLRKRFEGIPATEQEDKLLDFLNRKVIFCLCICASKSSLEKCSLHD